MHQCCSYFASVPAATFFLCTGEAKDLQSVYSWLNHSLLYMQWQLAKACRVTKCALKTLLLYSWRARIFEDMEWLKWVRILRTSFTLDSWAIVDQFFYSCKNILYSLVYSATMIMLPVIFHMALLSRQDYHAVPQWR